MVNGASFQTDASNVVEGGVWRPGDFSTLHEALDHAARSRHAMTFFNGRGEVVCELSYRELRAQAMHAARRLLGLVDVNRGDRVALVAETRSEFVILFFACQYAGLVPVPLPATVSLGGREHYLQQLRFLIENSGARAAFATDDFVDAAARRDRRAGSRAGRASGGPDRDARGRCQSCRLVGRRDRLRAVHLGQHPGRARRSDHPARRHVQPHRDHRRWPGARGPTTGSSRGCRSITTWVWSEKCSSRSLDRFRSPISVRESSRCGRGCG